MTFVTFKLLTENRLMHANLLLFQLFEQCYVTITFLLIFLNEHKIATKYVDGFFLKSKLCMNNVLKCYTFSKDKISFLCERRDLILLLFLNKL